MSTIRTIYVFRHGETDWNKESRFQGRVDIPLNETGRIQALKLKEFFERHPIEAMLTSDLSRAFETAQIAVGNLNIPVLKDARLRETNLGLAEGLTYTEVYDQFGKEVVEAWRSIDPNTWHIRFPEGESKEEHLQRIMNALHDFLRVHSYQSFAVSTHGGALRRLIHHLHPGLSEPVLIGNCVLYEIKFHSDKGLWEVDLIAKC